MRSAPTARNLREELQELLDLTGVGEGIVSRGQAVVRSDDGEAEAASGKRLEGVLVGMSSPI